VVSAANDRNSWGEALHQYVPAVRCTGSHKHGPSTLFHGASPGLASEYIRRSNLVESSVVRFAFGTNEVALSANAYLE
jgi:hypothetical protein